MHASSTPQAAQARALGLPGMPCARARLVCPIFECTLADATAFACRWCVGENTSRAMVAQTCSSPASGAAAASPEPSFDASVLANLDDEAVDDVGAGERSGDEDTSL